MAFSFVTSLRFARLACGKSLDEAALAGKISASLLSPGERGLSRPSPEVVARLEVYYGVPGLLLARAEPKETAAT